MSEEENHMLLIKSIQIQPLRNLFTALKDIITDVTMNITQNGIKVVEMDKSLTVLVNLSLKSSRFETFKCVPDQIITCFNTLNMFKIISTITSDDVFNMYITEDEFNNGIVKELEISFKNKKINETRDYQLKLMDPNTEILSMPEVNYSTVINLISGDFGKIIRDLASMSDRVEIESVGKSLKFKASGPVGVVVITRTETEGNMKFKKCAPDNRVIIRGMFSLKSLSQFIKCTPSSTDVELYLDNIRPLIVKYDVGTLGDLKLCLCQLPSDL